MRKPAQRVGTGGLSVNVASQADIHGYAATPGALQVHRLVQRGLTPAVAAATASLIYPPRDHWSVSQ